ncbi:pyrroline-5-carboxylate reductase [Brotaphodocola sp.]|uniref:pyrroline-5-carboxylate reductase n=1 Tax=Brotaphodocola sp. TaxID=3073577 RepID=UPI003D7D56D6
MSEFAYKYGFIGMGNMGFAMLKGLLQATPAEEITFSARNREKMAKVEAETGVHPASSNLECAKSSRYLILAVKPQQYDTVIGEIREVVSEDQVILSIAPGITIEDLGNRFKRAVRVVRAMPNTPALVGEGMTGVSFDETKFSEEERADICAFFRSFGRMEIVGENLMNAVVCASGSSPAYIYMIIEALADSVVKYGLPRAAAYQMVAQTVLGSAKMVLETGKHPGELKDQVCSPGGTTIAGVAALEEHGLRNALIKASDACYEKCTKVK